MKKLYTLVVLALAAFSVQAQVDVVFAVDMTGVAVSDNGLHIAGDLQAAAGGAGDWDPSDDNFKLEDPDGNGVYSITLNLPDGDYAYKYVNDNAWGNNEGLENTMLTADCSVDDGGGNINRVLSVAGATSLPVYLYDSCEESELAVGITDISTIKGISIAPNPFSDMTVVSFETTRNSTFQVSLSTMTGQVVRNYVVAGNALEIARGDLATGIYILTFQNEAGEFGSEKLIIR